MSDEEHLDGSTEAADTPAPKGASAEDPASHEDPRQAPVQGARSGADDKTDPDRTDLASDDFYDANDEPADRDSLIEDPDADIEAVNDDVFAATREVIADPDEWRLASRAKAYEDVADELAEGARGEPPVDEGKQKQARAIFWSGLGLGAASIVGGITLHSLGIGPRGIDAWSMTLATIGALLSIYFFEYCGFKAEQPAPGAPAGDMARLKHRNELVMNAFSISFALMLVALGLFELLALLVSLNVIADLSGTQITFAKNFIVVPAFVMAVVLAALYARTRVPSREPQYEHEEKVFAISLGVLAVSNLAGAFFAVGIPGVVAAAEIEARQGIYIQSLAVVAIVLMANLRLGYPNVFKIIEKEIERSKETDRQGAQTIHKRMLRNYVLALIFVVASIGFLVGNATGLVKTQGSNRLDVIVVVYLLFGILFLGILFVNFYQARQLRHKIVRAPKAGELIGKRRYNAAEVNKFIVIGISAGGALVFLFFTLLVSIGALTQFGPFALTPRNGTDFFVMAALIGLGPYGFYYARERARIRTIDEKFPDFLRDLAESQRAGMTLPRALVTASKGAYGPLTGEIKIMASQVEWGVNFQEALQRFSTRTRTPLIERTVSLVCEAASSGGNVVDVLAAASDDAREIKNILSERKAQMSVYSLIIYIAFFVFLTVIAVLNSQFIPELARSTAKVAGTTLGGIQFSDIDVPTYQQLFFHAALIQAIGGGLVSGVMTEGHPFSGLRHSFIMTLLAYGLFRFVIL